MEDLQVGAELLHPEALENVFKVLSTVETPDGLMQVDAYYWPVGETLEGIRDYDRDISASGVLKKYIGLQSVLTAWKGVRYKINYIIPLHLPPYPDFTGAHWHFNGPDTDDEPFVIKPLY